MCCWIIFFLYVHIFYHDDDGAMDRIEKVFVHSAENVVEYKTAPPHLRFARLHIDHFRPISFSLYLSFSLCMRPLTSILLLAHTLSSVLLSCPCQPPTCNLLIHAILCLHNCVVFIGRYCLSAHATLAYVDKEHPPTTPSSYRRANTIQFCHDHRAAAPPDRARVIFLIFSVPLFMIWQGFLILLGRSFSRAHDQWHWDSDVFFCVLRGCGCVCVFVLPCSSTRSV